MQNALRITFFSNKPITCIFFVADDVGDDETKQSDVFRENTRAWQLDKFWKQSVSIYL